MTTLNLVRGRLSRGDFLKGLLCTASVAATPRVFAAKPRIDPSLTALIADTHVSALLEQAFYTDAPFSSHIADILRHDPLPGKVVIFGDIAYLYGKKEDYVKSRKFFKLLTDAGIEVVYGLGNHDRREPFWEVFPEEAAKTGPVAGRQITVAQTANLDLLMLDSLDQPPTDDRWISPGNLGDEQGEWLKEALPKWKRPVMVCSHHPLGQLKAGGEALSKLLFASPNVIGYVHGHDHVWQKNLFEGPWDWQKGEELRSVCLPCSGLFGDIGFAWLKSTPTGCRIELIEKDFYYVQPRPEGQRPPLWEHIVAENKGAVCNFCIPRM